MDCGADLRASREGALALAVWNDCLDTVEALIDRGADVRDCALIHRVLETSVRENKLEMARLLLDRGVPPAREQQLPFADGSGAEASRDGSSAGGARRRSERASARGTRSSGATLERARLTGTDSLWQSDSRWLLLKRAPSAFRLNVSPRPPRPATSARLGRNWSFKIRPKISSRLEMKRS
jgi:hypothetical protein